MIYQAATHGCHLKGSVAYLVKCAGAENCHACAIVRPPAPPAPAPKGAKNILFMVSDDFRPSSRAYGVAQSNTPHLDRLAATGILFTHGHVQFSYCAPR